MSVFKCCESFHKTKICKIMTFVLMLGLNTTDVIADWCLYRNLAGLVSGLVYGPVADYILKSVLAFAILGTIIFPLEIVNAALKIFCDRPLINVDLFSVISLWFADLPLTMLNARVAACREELVTDFQLFKGGVVITGAVIRILILMVRYCSKKQLREVKDRTWKSCRNVTWRALVVSGAILTSVGSILIFIFALFHFNGQQLVANDASRHFENVGIFIDQNFVSPRNNLTGNKLLKIIDIETIRKSKSDLIIRCRTEDVANQPRFLMADNTSSALQSRKCYRLSSTNNGLEVSSKLPVSSCSDLDTSGNSYDTVFRFHFMMPIVDFFSSSQIFGDIYYNVERRFSNGSVDVRTIEKPSSDVVRYFRFEGSKANSTDLIFAESSLMPIGDVWKTGYFSCNSTGSYTPNHNESLSVDNSHF
ncbi:uncharacterized protein LOC135476723 [Liolophura sinensis]|uniref:uncharacterized protein LOC135476723 n=1 Tax=Liolophura sinensis TaxID=3198878 RepID=UPI0031580191